MKIIVEDAPGYLTSREVRALLRVSDRTLIRWEAAGVLVPAGRTSRRPHGHRRYALADVEAYLNRGRH